MELKIHNRDYVSDGIGGLQRVSGKEEVLERILYRLTVRRGSFPFDETLGSNLHLLGQEKDGEKLSAAKKYVAEALTQEKNLTVTDVELKRGEDNLLYLTVSLCYQGENAAVSLTIEE